MKDFKSLGRSTKLSVLRDQRKARNTLGLRAKHLALVAWNKAIGFNTPEQSWARYLNAQYRYRSLMLRRLYPLR